MLKKTGKRNTWNRRNRKQSHRTLDPKERPDHINGIQIDDVVEHSSGKRGKVVEIDNGTLIVSIGPGDRVEWPESACDLSERECNRKPSL